MWLDINRELKPATRTGTSTRTLQNNKLDYRIQSFHVRTQQPSHFSAVNLLKQNVNTPILEFLREREH